MTSFIVHWQQSGCKRGMRNILDFPYGSKSVQTIPLAKSYGDIWFLFLTYGSAWWWRRYFAKSICSMKMAKREEED